MDYDDDIELQTLSIEDMEIISEAISRVCILLEEKLYIDENEIVLACWRCLNLHLLHEQKIRPNSTIKTRMNKITIAQNNFING